MKRVLMYMHSGSGNRGCEAIVRSTLDILGCSKENTAVLSNSLDEDKKAGLEQKCDLLPGRSKSVEQLNIFQRGLANLYNRLFGSEKVYFYMMYKPFWQTDFRDTIALSIGGDHYCYKGGEQDLAWHNELVRKKGGKSVLWGCSVEPSLLTKHVVKDLMSYDLITARESITYNALKNSGVKKVYLYPDPAFSLKRHRSKYSGLIGKNVVGINMSPYVTASAGNPRMGEDNYSQLIKWILEHTEMSVVLLPHVIKTDNNDILVMDGLYRQYARTNRVMRVDCPLNCMELKDLIARCRFFVGARTHATVAAYSSCVPTLVAGYSVKAKGIAVDIFGNHENYMMPVQSLKNPDDLTHAFRWIVRHEDNIRRHLREFMPGYRAKALAAGQMIKQLIDEK